MHQLDQIAAGQTPDDLLDAAAMSAADARTAARRLPRRGHGGPGAASGVRLSLRRTEGGAGSRQVDDGGPRHPVAPAEWCAIDLELTGLHRSDEIIAIGAVPIRDGALILGEAMYSLARPEHPPKHASVLVHKLRSVDLREAPPLDDAIDQLLETMTGRVPVFHTAMVERAFLGKELRRRRLRLPDDVDTEVLGRLWLRQRDGVTPGGPAAVTTGTGAGPARGGPPSRAGRRPDDGQGVHRAGQPPRRRVAADGRLAAGGRAGAGRDRRSDAAGFGTG